MALRKLTYFHVISWCRNFAERQTFRRVPDESPETIQNLCLSTNFSFQGIRWSYGILHSVALSESFGSSFWYISIDNSDRARKNLNGTGITSSNHEKFLGALIDTKLNVDVHIKNLESRAKTKYSCQNKQLPTLDQKLILINSAIKPQFS